MSPHEHKARSSWNPFSRLSQSHRIFIVIFIATAFLATELIIGFRNRSLALVADAFHVTSDLIGYVVALVAIHKSQADQVTPPEYSFGYQRAAMLGGFFNGAFLMALGVSIILQSIERFLEPNEVLEPVLVLAIGAAGLGSNIIMATILGGHSHGVEPVLVGETIPNQQDHAEHAHARNDKKQSSHTHDLNILSVLIHVLGDAINNVAVMISAGIYIATGFLYADPIASTFVGCMIIATSYPLVLKSGRLLLEKAPEHIDIEGVKADVERISGKGTVHELHVWNITQSKVLASMHVRVDDQSVMGFNDLSGKIRECLHYWQIHNATIQPEYISVPSPIERQPSQTSIPAPSEFPPVPSLTYRLACKARCRMECVEDPCCE